MSNEVSYLSGFGNYFQSESIAGALPKKQNSPQEVPLGLYAEQLSGSAFTRPRKYNLFCWLYRIQPSVLHSKFYKIDQKLLSPSPFSSTSITPNQMRWDPLPIPNYNCNFIESLITWAKNGSCSHHSGSAIHLYACNTSMQQEFFYNADGELLIIPESGILNIFTEMGLIELIAGEIAVIPRGIKFQIKLQTNSARGYVLENYAEPLTLPDLGPIGANGLANPRDFLYPTAHFFDKKGDFKLIAKFQDQLFQADLQYHPLDVIAWHGNYAPYKYDLKKFNSINTVSFDHPDPSIFTVLTSQTSTPGIANVDFVIFPERWMVAIDTFRPPYYHRNIMSEYMGLIYGAYDAKQESFLPGGGSLHNCMSAHGPDKNAFQKATEAILTPEYQANTLAFMFESKFIWQISQYAETTSLLQKDYYKCWSDLPRKFKN